MVKCTIFDTRTFVVVAAATLDNVDSGRSRDIVLQKYYLRVVVSVLISRRCSEIFYEFMN